MGTKRKRVCGGKPLKGVAHSLTRLSQAVLYAVGLSFWNKWNSGGRESAVEGNSIGKTEKLDMDEEEEEREEKRREETRNRKVEEKEEEEEPLLAAIGDGGGGGDGDGGGGFNRAVNPTLVKYSDYNWL
ncbi:hypothetical protein M0804_009813 [Polistes exclamans]|nr:hypothetical protein M0804_009813 [Polistes exclamans]